MCARQMSGTPRPDREVPNGTVTVRVIHGEMSKLAAAGTLVHLVGLHPDGKVDRITRPVNCWFGNVGSDGTAASVTSDPPPPPMAGTSIPKFLPEDCDAPTNVGAGDANKQQMEVRCLAAIGAGNWDPSLCDWFQMPAKPGSAAAKAAKKLSLTGETATLTPFCRLAGGLGGTLSCRPFLHRV